jgi:DNA-directed RNA polymerase subunit RPC12/RpoP
VSSFLLADLKTERGMSDASIPVLHLDQEPVQARRRLRLQSLDARCGDERCDTLRYVARRPFQVGNLGTGDTLMDVGPSYLPSLLLPCPHCGHRMVITVIEPAPRAYDAASSDLEDVTHSCLQCGTKLTRTMRSLFRAA